jgi:signal transduction histidine kinase
MMTLRVLIAEDSEIDTLLLVRHLRGSGYQPIYEQVDNAIALQSALNHHRWDIVLTDYVMPAFSGLDVLRLVQENQPQIPCIVVSGAIPDSTAIAAMKAGAHDYLMKDNLVRLGAVIDRELKEVAFREQCQEMAQQIEAFTEQRQLQATRQQMLGNVVAQIQTHLSTIRVSTELLKVNYGSNNPTQRQQHRLKLYQYLQQINRASEQINQLLVNLGFLCQLACSFIQLNPRTVSMQELTTIAIEGLPVSSNQQQRLQLNYENLPAEITADPELLRQILHNLLTNALKYSPPDSPVDIYLRASTQALLIEISDRGIGIPLQDLPYIDQPFYRGSNVEQIPGHGLGLAIVQECLKLHQGQIKIISHPEQGTSVLVTIPLKLQLCQGADQI